MLMNKIQRIAVFLFVSLFLILVLITRIRIIENKMYIQILSEDTYFNIQKHVAPRVIIKAFKKKKKNHLGKLIYLDETSDSLLYIDSSRPLDIIYIMTIRDGNVDDSPYKPDLIYNIEGNSVNFLVEDKKSNYLKYIDEISIKKIANDHEEQYYSFPTRRNSATFSLDQDDIENIDFEITYTSCNEKK